MHIYKKNNSFKEWKTVREKFPSRKREVEGETWKNNKIEAKKIERNAYAGESLLSLCQT